MGTSQYLSLKSLYFIYVQRTAELPSSSVGCSLLDFPSRSISPLDVRSCGSSSSHDIDRMGAFEIKHHAISCQNIREDFTNTSPPSSADPGWRMHMKQYIPRNNPSPKEGDLRPRGWFYQRAVWAFLGAFVKGIRGKGGSVRAIWVADIVNMGPSEKFFVGFW